MPLRTGKDNVGQLGVKPSIGLVFFGVVRAALCTLDLNIANRPLIL